MKKGFFAALLITSSALMTACGDESPSAGWAQRGDKLVRNGRYQDAYQAYISRCNDELVPRQERMAGCNAARDLRLTAKSHGHNTSNW